MRSGLEPHRFDDILLAESQYGGGDLARYAAVVNGMLDVPGVALNRHVPAVSPPSAWRPRR